MPFSDNRRNTILSTNKSKKERLKNKALYLIYKNQTLSAADISRFAGVSIPTTNSILSELITEKLVIEKGIGESKGGRKPLIYGLAEDSFYVVACDMGRFKAQLSVFNTQNKNVTPVIEVNTNIDDQELEEKLFQSVKNLIEKQNITYDKIIAVGVDMPGIINTPKGINYTIKEESLQNIKKRIQVKFNKPVLVENDARMQAFGEYKFGKAKNHNNAIVVNWSWGIGLGMILNDKIYSGANGFAGELSHIKLVENGELCICGKNGCLETVASANTLLKLVKTGIANGVVTQLGKKFAKNPDELTIEDITSAAKTGDEFSISMLSKIGLALGKGLSYIIQILNPDIIILGGPISKANQFVLTPIHQALNKYCIENISSKTEIIISDISEKSGLLGITAMLFQKFFNGSL